MISPFEPFSRFCGPDAIERCMKNTEPAAGRSTYKSEPREPLTLNSCGKTACLRRSDTFRPLVLKTTDALFITSDAYCNQMNAREFETHHSVEPLARRKEDAAATAPLNRTVKSFRSAVSHGMPV